MKIAILGTRGIPNNYGGFEQCAEKMSQYFLGAGNEVTVYNPSDHKYKKSIWNGVRIKHIPSNEKKYSYISLFVYDYLSLHDVVQHNFDIVLELGYAPAALFYFLKRNSRAKIVTAMDGLDWKRSKWNALARRILKYSEKVAIKKSDALVSDNPGIQSYIYKKYKKDSHFIPNGTNMPGKVSSEILKQLGVKKEQYFLVISRMVPENNIDAILSGYVLSKSQLPLLVIGPNVNKYGKTLQIKYQAYPSIRFVGGIYDFPKLSSLRNFARIYFHGHSVGGTNPSLLEAMASGAYIIAHDNEFNRHVLGDKAMYFHDEQDISSKIRNYKGRNRQQYINRYKKEIKAKYTWDKVSAQYLALFEDLLKEGKS